MKNKRKAPPRPIEVKSQRVLPQKQFNRYRYMEKVLIVSNTYKWGRVSEVKIVADKFQYTITFGNGEKSMKLPEEALLPYIRKWQWKILGFLGIVY